MRRLVRADLPSSSDHHEQYRARNPAGSIRASAVIVEMREYTLQAGKVSEYLQLYEREGLEVQREILGQMVGYYSTEVGSAINEVVHLWAYESFEDRRQRRARLAAHPGWQSYLKKIRPMLVEQRNRILIPAPFFEPELRR